MDDRSEDITAEIRKKPDKFLCHNPLGMTAEEVQDAQKTRSDWMSRIGVIPEDVQTSFEEDVRDMVTNGAITQVQADFILAEQKNMALYCFYHLESVES